MKCDVRLVKFCEGEKRGGNTNAEREAGKEVSEGPATFLTIPCVSVPSYASLSELPVQRLVCQPIRHLPATVTKLVSV